MARMQNIKATICENNFLPRTAPRIHLKRKIGSVANFARQMSGLKQNLLANLRQRNWLGSKHLHLKSSGHIGQLN